MCLGILRRAEPCEVVPHLGLAATDGVREVAIVVDGPHHRLVANLQAKLQRRRGESHAVQSVAADGAATCGLCLGLASRQPRESASHRSPPRTPCCKPLGAAPRSRRGRRRSRRAARRCSRRRPARRSGAAVTGAPGSTAACTPSR
eukprot:747315-Prymnesium_polylepis.1